MSVIFSSPRNAFAFVAVVLGFFMALLDTTIVSITLPTMMKEFGTDISTISWVVSAYNLAFGSLLVAASRIADQHGRKKIFIVGLALFVITSWLCGQAESAGWLITFRAFQGLAGAMVVPVTVPLGVSLFPREKSGLVIGIWAAISGFAAALGPTLGGIIAEKFTWAWIFYINIPLGIISILLTAFLIDESYDPTASKTLDIGGTLTLIAGTFALSYGLIQANEWGWGDPRILALFVVSLLFYIVFILIERKSSEPMLPLDLFKNRAFVAGVATLFLIGVGTMDGIFFLSFFMTEIMGLTQLDAGVTVSVIALSSIMFSIVGGALSDKIGSRNITMLGMAVFCTSLWWYSTLDSSATKADLIPKMIMAGAGLGLALSTVVTATIRSVAPEKSGIASGVGNMFRVLGHVFGAAIVVALFNHSLTKEIKVAIPLAIKLVEQDTILKPDIKKVINERINSSLTKKRDRIPTQEDVVKALDKKEAEMVAKATPFKKPFVKAGFKMQREQILKQLPELRKIFLDHAAKAYAETFLICCFLLLTGIITAAFSDPGRKRKA